MSKIREEESLECGRMHIWALKTQKLPGPLSGPWTLVEIAHFAHTTPLRYVGNFRPQNLGSSPLTKSWTPTWVHCRCPSGWCTQFIVRTVRSGRFTLCWDQLWILSDACFASGDEKNDSESDLTFLLSFYACATDVVNDSPQNIAAKKKKRNQHKMHSHPGSPVESKHMWRWHALVHYAVPQQVTTPTWNKL